MNVAKAARIGCLVSVNVGLPSAVQWEGRSIRTAIWKEPVIGSVEVRGST